MFYIHSIKIIHKLCNLLTGKQTQQCVKCGKLGFVLRKEAGKHSSSEIIANGGLN